MGKDPFANPKLCNNNVKKNAWEKLPVCERIERGLEGGHEIEHIHRQLYGLSVKIKKIREDLKNHSKPGISGKQAEKQIRNNRRQIF